MTQMASALTREDLFEKRELDLHVISPIHIGTKEGSLSSLEFAVHKGTAFVIDDEKFGLFLKKHGMVDHFVEAARSGPVNIKKFIESNGGFSLPAVLEKISGYSIPGEVEQMKEFRSFVRDGRGQIYLPGTAIKGVFRTAVLYKMLSDNPARMGEIQGSAERNLLNIQGGGRESAKKRFSAKWLQEDLLEGFSLANAKKGPNADLLRCLKISDAYPIDGCETRVIKLLFLSKRADEGFYWSKKKKGFSSTDKPLEIWIEVLSSGALRTELVWDRELFDRFKRENPHRKWPADGIDGLLSLLSKMSKDVIEHEKRFFKTTGSTTLRGSGINPEQAAKALGSFYANIPGDVMRIGFGSGMLSTTVNLHFPQELRQKIRDACGFPRPNDPAPKSRRVSEAENGQWRPMGWIAVGHPGIGMKENMPIDIGLAQGDCEVIADRDSGTGQRPPIAGRPTRPLGRPVVHLRKAHHAVEEVAWADLKRQADMIEPNDSLGLQRIVKTIEKLEDTREQKAAAEYLKRKLEKANLWKKNPLKPDIEMLLSDDIEEN